MALMNTLHKCLVCTETTSTCNSLCGMYSSIATFLCQVCADNNKCKNIMGAHLNLLLQVFHYRPEERGCGCIHNACIRIVSEIYHKFDHHGEHIPIAVVPRILEFVDPDSIPPSVLFRITRFVKDIICPKRSRVNTLYQPVILKNLIRTTRNKMKFFDDNIVVSRSQKDKRVVAMREHEKRHDTNINVLLIEDSEPISNVLWLFHIECVEIFALCCKESKGCPDKRLQSLLRIETLVAIFTDDFDLAVKCPPLMYSYGIFLHHVHFLNMNDFSKQKLLELSSSEKLWKLVTNFCNFCSNTDNVLNSFRSFTFDVAIPVVEYVLKSLPLGKNDDTLIEASRLARQQAQDLLRVLLSLSDLSTAERSVVEDSCLYFDISISPIASNEKKADDELSVKDNTLLVTLSSAKPMAGDFMSNFSADDSDFSYEMAKQSKPLLDMPGSALLHIRKLLDNCPTIEQIRTETSTEFLISSLRAMTMDEDENKDSTASVISDQQSDPAAPSSSTYLAFYSSFVHRLTAYAMKIVPTIRKESTHNSTVNNVIFIFDIFTSSLRICREGNNQYREMQQLFNSNSAVQLVLEIISVVNDDNRWEHNDKILLNHALQFGYELLSNTNHEGQELLYDLMCKDSAMRMKKFFIAIVHSVSHYTSVVRTMIQSRNGVKAYDMAASGTTSSLTDEQYAEVLEQAQSTFLLLQLMCEGHFLKMQEIFENGDGGYDVLTAATMFFEQLLPNNMDITHLILGELLVGYSIVDFLIESVQGPCAKNQFILLENGRLLACLSHWSYGKIAVEEDVVEYMRLQPIIGRIRQQNANLFDAVNFFSLKVMKNKCLILRLSLLEARKWRSTDCLCHVLHESLLQNCDPRAHLMAIYQEYQSAKSACSRNRLPAYKARTLYRIIRSEAHLTLSYFLAIKRWIPNVLENVLPQRLEYTSRKQFSSRNDYLESRRIYKSNKKYRRVFSSFMDRQKTIEIFWAGKGIFQVSFQTPRQVM